MVTLKGYNDDPNELAENINCFIFSKLSENECKRFVEKIFGEKLGIDADDPIWNLLKYIEQESDFYTAPASTRFHSNVEYGLVRHSLLVVANGIKLAPIMLSGDVEMYYLIISCLFHDLCKTNMYEMAKRNNKNEDTGYWEKIPYYRVKDDYISYGHGIESMLRINKFVSMPESWNNAIRWHMGAYDISLMDKIALNKSLATYREVLFLQTADMLAGLVDDI
jgi:hypothetical protein